MKTATKWTGFGEGVARGVALCLLALAGVLLQAHEARAQWTAPDAAGNVSTAAGVSNVGVGTASPANVLTVRRDQPYNSATDTNSMTQVQVRNDNASGFASFSIWSGTERGRVQYNAGMPNIFLTSRGNIPLYLGTNDTIRMAVDGTNGNVGIGTTTPGILNGVSFTGYVPLHIQGATNRFIVIDSPVSYSGIALNDSSQPVDSRIWTVTQSAGGGKLTFSTVNDAGANTPQVIIDRAGNMGVGTTAPAAKLHVAGNITVDGNINAKYQDVAEWVPSTQKLQAGTVVILDSRQENHVTASTTAYDTRVAGVVSAQPGLTLGVAADDKSLVATTGRVKVRVDATRAPIRIGDLIVTSDVAGVAMKSEPVNVGGVSMHRPGTIIGKALEALDKGRGEILVLLSLQ